MEVRELLAPIEERGSTGHVRRPCFEAADLVRLGDQGLLEGNMSWLARWYKLRAGWRGM
jgi:hypothetical protein